MAPTTVEWRASPAPVPYEDAVGEMEARVAAIREGKTRELIWCLEHPPLYTAGTSADAAELLDVKGLPVYKTGRGGRTTWHGPGQRVAYVMLDLKPRGGDVRGFVRDLEAWVIATLAQFGVTGERRDGRVGIWVAHDGKEEKIAAIGVRVRRWVSYHGIAVNVAPDLSHYDGIIPCGISTFGVTSLDALGIKTSMADVDAALRRTFEDVFASETTPIR
jgi:lipoyl(octanoyl) transferase